MCKKIVKNSEPFGKKCLKTAGRFFDSHRILFLLFIVSTEVKKYTTNTYGTQGVTNDSEKCSSILYGYIIRILS